MLTIQADTATQANVQHPVVAQVVIHTAQFQLELSHTAPNTDTIHIVFKLINNTLPRLPFRSSLNHSEDNVSKI